MYHSWSTTRIVNSTSVRIVKKSGENQSCFSGTGGVSWANVKTYERPTVVVRSRITHEIGSHAAYPSRKRTIGRDQRAVTMRCTATIVTAAEETLVKKSQLKCSARQARYGSRNRPSTKTIAPTTARPRSASFSVRDTGAVAVRSSSSREG